MEWVLDEKLKSLHLYNIQFFLIFPHTGILSSQDLWKENRKFSLVTMRDFGLGKKSLEERIQEEISSLHRALDETNGEPCSVDNLIIKSVSNIICTITFGKR